MGVANCLRMRSIIGWMFFVAFLTAMMSLLNYFKRTHGGPLPHPTDPLMPPTVNKLVRAATLDKPSATSLKSKRGLDREIIGKKAVIDGIDSAMRYSVAFIRHCVPLPLHALIVGSRQQKIICENLF